MKAEHKESWLDRVRSSQGGKKVGRQQKITKTPAEASKKDDIARKLSVKKQIENATDNIETSDPVVPCQANVNKPRTSTMSKFPSRNTTSGEKNSTFMNSRASHSSTHSQKPSLTELKQRTNAGTAKRITKKVENTCKTTAVSQNSNKSRDQKESFSQKEDSLIGAKRPSSEVSESELFNPSKISTPIKVSSEDSTKKKVSTLGQNDKEKSLIPKRVSYSTVETRPKTASLSSIKKPIKHYIGVAKSENVSREASCDRNPVKISNKNKRSSGNDRNDCIPNKLKFGDTAVKTKQKLNLTTKSLESKVNETVQAEGSPVVVIKVTKNASSRTQSSCKKDSIKTPKSSQGAGSRGSSNVSAARKCSKSSGFSKSPQRPRTSVAGPNLSSRSNDRKDKGSESAVSLSSSLENGKNKPYHTTYGANKQNVSVIRNKLRWQEFLSKAKHEIRRQLADENKIHEVKPDLFEHNLCQERVEINKNGSLVTQSDSSQDLVSAKKTGEDLSYSIHKQSCNIDRLPNFMNQSLQIIKPKANSKESIISDKLEGNECSIFLPNKAESDEVHPRQSNSGLAFNTLSIRDENRRPISSDECRYLLNSGSTDIDGEKNKSCDFDDSTLLKKLGQPGSTMDHDPEEFKTKQKTIYTNCTISKTEDRRMEDNKEHDLARAIIGPHAELADGSLDDIDSIQECEVQLNSVNNEHLISIPLNGEKWVEPLIEEASFLNSPPGFIIRSSFCDISDEKINLEAIETLPESSKTDLASSRSNSSTKTNDEWADAKNSLLDESVQDSQVSSYRTARTESNPNTPYITPTDSDDDNSIAHRKQWGFVDYPVDQVPCLDASTVEKAIEKYFEKMYNMAADELDAACDPRKIKTEMQSSWEAKWRERKGRHDSLMKSHPEEPIQKRKKVSTPGHNKRMKKLQNDGKHPFNSNAVWTYKYHDEKKSSKHPVSADERCKTESNIINPPTTDNTSEDKEYCQKKSQIPLPLKKYSDRDVYLDRYESNKNVAPGSRSRKTKMEEVLRCPTPDSINEHNEFSREHEKRLAAAERYKILYKEKRKNALELRERQKNASSCNADKNDLPLHCRLPRPSSRVTPTVPPCDAQRGNRETVRQKRKP